MAIKKKKNHQIFFTVSQFMVVINWGQGWVRNSFLNIPVWHSFMILAFFGFGHPVCISTFGDPKQTQKFREDVTNSNTFKW